MNENVVKLIKQIHEYIVGSAFKTESIFVRNIRVMKFNTDLEWFNCALIAMNFQASNRVIVNTLQGWDAILEFEEENKPVLNISPVHLLKPVYDNINHTFHFDLIDTYYIDQIDGFMHNKVNYVRDSSIERVIKKKENYDKLLKVLKYGWQDVFVESYLKLFDFYHFSNNEKRLFYKNLLMYVFGEELRIVNPHTLSSLKIEDDNKLTVYKHMHELISCFHIAFQSYLDDLDALIIEIGDLTIEQPRLRSETFHLMEKMSKGISLVNETEMDEQET